MANCYNYGNITSTSGCVSGLAGATGYSSAGSNSITYINNCYNKGTVTGNSAGALAGQVFHGVLYNSYYLGANNDAIGNWDNTYWDGRSGGNGNFESSSDDVKVFELSQGTYKYTGTSNGKNLLTTLNDEKQLHDDPGNTEVTVKQGSNYNDVKYTDIIIDGRTYLPWTTSKTGVNDGYPVFDYPITVKYKYDGEEEWKTDNSIAWASSATAAAGDTVTVSAADGEAILSMYGKVHSPVDIGAYTNTEYDNDSMVTVSGSSFTMPAFATTIYVTLKKADWISALVYDFPTDTAENKTIMLVTGTDKQNDVQFDITLTGEIIYLPDMDWIKTVEAQTYNKVDGTLGEAGYTDELQDAYVTADAFGTKFLAAKMFNISASDRSVGITFRPQSISTGDTGKKYTWRSGDKWLTEAAE